MGRVVTTLSPDTGTTRYAYDEAGNLVSKTDANGIAIAYCYDSLNRLTAVLFPDTTQNITYSYDQGLFGKGKRTGMTGQGKAHRYDRPVGQHHVWLQWTRAYGDKD
jgi:YD repeat-containing protein